MRERAAAQDGRTLGACHLQLLSGAMNRDTDYGKQQGYGQGQAQQLAYASQQQQVVDPIAWHRPHAELAPSCGKPRVYARGLLGPFRRGCGRARAPVRLHHSRG